jgi:AcrR family transcriptional regulator
MDQQREQIIQIAVRMFHQFGIRNVSINEICSDLHISKKTFYMHFAQKQDLVDAVITYEKQIGIEKFSKGLKNKNAIDALIFIVREIKKNVDCTPQALWYDIEKYYPQVFEKHNQQKIETIKIGFEQNLRQGIEEGFYRDDLDVELTSYFHSIQLKTTFEMMEESSKKYSKKRLLDFFIDLIFHLIASEKGLKYMNENILND